MIFYTFMHFIAYLVKFMWKYGYQYLVNLAILVKKDIFKILLNSRNLRNCCNSSVIYFAKKTELFIK